MNVGCMNADVCHILTLFCDLPATFFTANPLLCLHEVVNCPLDANFRISLEVVGHLGTFCLLFYEYCELGNTALFTYCFCLLYSREVCTFGCNHILS